MAMGSGLVLLALLGLGLLGPVIAGVFLATRGRR
jgi:hypothetical protein